MFLIKRLAAVGWYACGRPEHLANEIALRALSVAGCERQFLMTV